MKQMKRLVIACSALAGLIVGQSALAADVSINYTNSAKLGGNVSVGYLDGTLVPNPVSPTNPVNVLVGGDSYTNVSASTSFAPQNASFDAWCVDIMHYLNLGPTTYHVDDVNNSLLVSTFGSTRVNDLQLLGNQRYTGLHTATDSAAFQLAVWSVMFSTDTSNYSLNSAGFHGTSSAAAESLANTFLSSLHNYTGTLDSYDISYLYGGAPNSQNLVEFSPTNITLAVPEPESYGLILAGLMLMAAVTARSRRAA